MGAPTFTGRAGVVVMGDGRVRLLRRGDTLPDGAREGEVERLTSLGVLTGVTADSGETDDGLTIGEWMRGASRRVSDILDRVGSDPDAALEALEAEEETTGGDPRPRLVAALRDIAGGGD